MPFDGIFNAREIAPNQGGGGHPVGNKFQFTITNTSAEKNKETPGGKFVVEFTSPHGSVKHNYNLWNESEAARRISGEQLSALCYAVGIFDVDFKNDGAALRGGIGLMDIGFQKGQEPSPEKPAGGFVELKKIYDKNGNEPGKAAQPQQTQQQTKQPEVQNGFGAQQNTAANSNAAVGVGWQQQATGTGEKAPWS